MKNIFKIIVVLTMPVWLIPAMLCVFVYATWDISEDVYKWTVKKLTQNTERK